MTDVLVNRMLATVLRATVALRASEGNPNHDDKGQFASSPGGHGKHHAARQKRKEKHKKERLKQLKGWHKEWKGELKQRKAGHRKERKELVKGQRKEHADLIKEHAKARKEHVKGEKSDRADLAETHAGEHKELSRTHAREVKLADRNRVSHVKRIETKHNEAMGRVRDEHIAKSEKLDRAKAKGKDVGELEGRLVKQTMGKLGRIEASKTAKTKAAHEHHDQAKSEMTGRHKEEHRDLKSEHKQARSDLRDEHRDARESLREEHREEHVGLKDQHQEERREMRESHRAERKEAIDDIQNTLESEDYKAKGGRAPTQGYAPKNETRWKRHEALNGASMRKGRHNGSVVDSSDRSGGGMGDRLAEGLRDRDLDVRGRALGPHVRFHASRTTKASSAESILAHCLKRRGWTARFREGRLTGRQRLTLLNDIRMYARAWLRHEAEGLFRAYGRGDEEEAQRQRQQRQDDDGSWSVANTIGSRTFGENLGTYGQIDRALIPTIKHHVGRFFDRAKAFVREAILAGVLAFGEPSADELGMVDQQARVQAEFFDSFRREVEANPPVELSPPAAEPSLFLPPNMTLEPSLDVQKPMTGPEFVARAESYGNAPWQAQNIIRAKGQPSGTLEARFHFRRESHHECETCIGETAKGWVPAGTLLPIGDSECMGNCDCYFYFRMPGKSKGWVIGERPAA
jgi:hypothetical protein